MTQGHLRDVNELVIRQTTTGPSLFRFHARAPLLGALGGGQGPAPYVASGEELLVPTALSITASMKVPQKLLLQ